MFHKSCAALTFFCAVSRVNGGRGGLVSLAIARCLLLDLVVYVVCLKYGNVQEAP